MRNNGSVLSLNFLRKIQKIEQLEPEDLEKRINSINELYEYVKEKPVNLKDPKQIEKLNEIITQIYRAEMETLEEQFGFKMEFLIGEEGKPGKGEDFLGLCSYNKNIQINTESLYKSLKSKRVNKRLEGCLEIIKVISHEIQHQRQELLVEKNLIGVPKEALKIAESQLALDVLERDFYQKNHDEMYIEKDSEEKANKKAKEAKKDVTKSERDELIYKLEKKLGMLPTSYVSTDMYEEEMEFFFLEQREENILEELVDQIIAEEGDAEWLGNYPVLQKKYDIYTGRRLSVEELLKNKEEEEKLFRIVEKLLTEEERKTARKNIQETYEELIYQRLKDATPEDLKNIDKGKLKQILYQIKKSTIKEANQMKKDSKRIFELDDQYNEEELEKKPKIIKGILKLVDNGKKRFKGKILLEKEESEEEKYETNGYTPEIEEYLQERLEVIERIEKEEELETEESQSEKIKNNIIEKYTIIKYRINKFVKNNIIGKTIEIFRNIKEKFLEKTKRLENPKKLEQENNSEIIENIELKEPEDYESESTKNFKEKYQIKNINSNTKKSYEEKTNKKEKKSKNGKER